MSENGITVQASTFSVTETIDRLQTLIKSNGATIYARIDQQAELNKAGITIAPLVFLLFGKPAAGGKLIQANPLVALDLPLKFMAWEDGQQKVWLAYNAAAYTQSRYELSPDISAILNLDKLVLTALDNNA